MNEPILTWTSAGGFGEVEAPEWWADTLAKLWPDSWKNATPASHYGPEGGRRIEIYHVPEPGRGFVALLLDPAEEFTMWLPDAGRCEDFLSRREEAWLAKPAGTQPT